MKRFVLALLGLALLITAILPAMAEEAILPVEEAGAEAAGEVKIEEDWTPEAQTPGEIDAGEWEVPEDAVEPGAAVPEAFANDSGAEDGSGDGTVAMPESVKLGVGERFALAVPGAIFQSSKKSVAKVSKGGVVTGKKKGIAVIRALVDGVEVARCKVRVLAKPKKVTLSETRLAMAVGQAKRLKAKLPQKTASRIAWSSSDMAVATVDDAGVVNAVGEGTAKITASTYNGAKATCAVTVCPPDVPVSLTLGMKTLSLGVKESVMVVPQVNEGAVARFKWSTKSKKIAAVNANGVITGKRKGSTTVTVKTQNGLKATLTVVVRKAPSKVTVSPKAGTLAVGETGRVKAKLPKNTASQIAWTSSDEGVAIVYPDGTVLGCAPGTATITGWTFNGKHASCAVTVTGGSSGDQALREKLVGEWKVTEVEVDGLHADTCDEFMTLNVLEGGRAHIESHREYSLGGDCHWMTVEGKLVLLSGDSGDAIVLQPDRNAEKLSLAVGSVTLIFTQYIDPVHDVWFQNIAKGEVDGRWVADRVSFLAQGLTFMAADIGFEGTLEIRDDTVQLSLSFDGETQERTMPVWYPGDGIYPELARDGEFVGRISYHPSLDSLCCMLLPNTEDNYRVYFRREEE